MHEKKERLDILLVRRNYFPSRQQAQAAIMAGLIVVDGEKIEKAGTRVTREAIIRILGKTHPYVSRGGLKLEKALQHFNISLEKKNCYGCGCFYRRFYRLRTSIWCRKRYMLLMWDLDN
jgi:23S rRNA (cytidine1920-2'-O)/16S rRNA (cytidine1409-2'-O)-methyltransferase